MNKICIYSFYDKKGIVDNFVLDMLREMEKYVSQIFFVSNGEIDSKGKKKLKEISCVKIFERENKGFDITGIKEALIKIGFQKLKAYDELIIINSSIMGPVYSFKDMFTEMSLKDLDFWGMTTYSKEEEDPWDNSKYNYIPAHLQSYFLVIGKKMLSSLEFEKYWRKLPPIKTYEDAVSRHEVIFTKYFEELGYKWESYIQSQDLNHLCNYHLNYMPVELIKNRKCPIFKRKSFILDYRIYMSVTKGNEDRDLFNYLKEIGYNTDNIIENITRTANQMDIRFCLETNIFTGEKKISGSKKGKSLVFIFIIRRQEEWERLSLKINEIQKNIDIYIYLDVDTKLYKKIIQEIGNKNNIFIEKGNVDKYLSYIQLISSKYELIGFFSIPEYKVEQVMSELLTLETAINSFIADSRVIEEIIEVFVENKYMGLMVPSIPLHGGYEGEVKQWEKSLFDNVKRLLNHLKIEVDLNIDKPSLGPVGGSFIIRSKVLNSIDSSLLLKFLNNKTASLKIFLNSLPYLAQANNLLTYMAISLEDRENYVNQLLYLFLERKENQKNFYAAKIYYELAGQIIEKNITKGVIKKYLDSRIFEVDFLLEYDTKRIRFDPIEYKGLYAKEVTAFVNNKQVDINPINGYRHGNSDLFITTDPQYDISYKFHKGDILKIVFKEFNVIFADELDIGFSGEKQNSYGTNINRAILDIKNYYEGSKRFRNTAKKYLKKVKRKLKKH